MDNTSRIAVRDAVAADIPALIAIKGEGGEALHRDRLRDARASGFRYLVLLLEGHIIGCACLVFRRPAHWSDAADTRHLPQIVDLQVAESQPSQGYGSAFIRVIEHLTAEEGYDTLYLSVEPLDNPRAYALYRRLGYQPLQAEPYRKTWAFTDSAGQQHSGEDWVADMVKRLTP